MQHDHFQPDVSLDPNEQKKLRVHLEQVDKAAFAANCQVLARTVGRVNIKTFQRLATATALARAHWVSASLNATEKALVPSDAEIARLKTLRGAYEELMESYDAMRRMVERGYLCFLDVA